MRFLKKIFKKNDVSFQLEELERDLFHLNNDFKKTDPSFYKIDISYLEKEKRFLINLVFKHEYISFKTSLYTTYNDYMKDPSVITQQLISLFQFGKIFKEKQEDNLFRYLYVYDLVYHNKLYSTNSTWLHSYKSFSEDSQKDFIRFDIDFHYEQRIRKDDGSLMQFYAKPKNKNIGSLNLPTYWVFNDWSNNKTNENVSYAYFWFGRLSDVVFYNKEEFELFLKNNAILLPTRAKLNIPKSDENLFVLDILKQKEKGLDNTYSTMSLIALFKYLFDEHLYYDLKTQELLLHTDTFNFFYNPDDKKTQIIKGWEIFKEYLSKLEPFNKEYNYITLIENKNQNNFLNASFNDNLKHMHTVSLSNDYENIKNQSLHSLYSIYLSGIYLFWKQEANKELNKLGTLKEFNYDYLKMQLDECLKTMQFYNNQNALSQNNKKKRIKFK